MHYSYHTRGFTLIELSIVLVIIGLLVGGVLTGQSLIRAAELRSITTQYNNYMTAVNTFQDKYFALPGDMANATVYWGANSGCPFPNTPGAGTQTCNGNGDGAVWTGGSYETFLFWQHLANAGLIEGSYSGFPDGLQSYSATLNNSPHGKLSNSIWWVWSWGAISGNPALGVFDGTYVNMLKLGSANGAEPGDIITAAENYNIDKKIDDGLPGTGTMVTREWGNCTNATASTQGATAVYTLDDTNKICSPFFFMKF